MTIMYNTYKLHWCPVKHSTNDQAPLSDHHVLILPLFQDLKPNTFLNTRRLFPNLPTFWFLHWPFTPAIPANKHWCSYSLSPSPFLPALYNPQLLGLRLLSLEHCSPHFSATPGLLSLSLTLNLLLLVDIPARCHLSLNQSGTDIHMLLMTSGMCVFTLFPNLFVRCPLIMSLEIP